MSLDDTEVEVTFDAISDGTRVTLEQRLVPGGTSADFYTGWHNIVGWFRDWILEKNGASSGSSADPERSCMVTLQRPGQSPQLW